MPEASEPIAGGNGRGGVMTTRGARGAQKRVGRALACALAGAALGLLALPASAQVAGSVVPTGRQDYFVLGHEQHVWNMMRRVQAGEGGPLFQNGMNSVVSAVASADSQVLTYDHWEDGLEADPWSPVQASTLVLGDNNPANGRACDWTNDPRVLPCGGPNQDTLFRGSAVTLNSDQGLGGGCTAGIRCTVPVNPRLVTDVRFDGGDRLVTSGGPLSLIHNQFPPPYPQIGGSTEVLPRQSFAGATSYSIPAGENLYTFGGPYQMFNYTSVNLVAFDDNTQVFVNSPGAGTVSFTLNRGQHYTNCLAWNAAFTCTGGAIDAAAAPAITINASTKISATGPIAILLFTGGDGTWATDFMPILPELLHGNDYILPSPGDNPAVLGSRPFNIYAYNPDPVNATTVTATDSVGTSAIALAAGATRDYFGAVGRYVPSNSTVRLTASRNFWGLAIHDHLSPANDWGYSWLATDFLTRNYTVSFSPGVEDPAANSTPAQRTALPPDAQCTIPPPGPGVCNSINRSPVFVAAALDNTLVKVDFDNDGQFDYVDTNGDDYPDNGVANDGTCATPTPPWNVPGLTNCLYRVDALSTLRVFDYTDYDNTGTRIQASKVIAVAYGQDTDRATGPDPIIDTGYTVYPLSQRFLDPVLVVGKTASPTVVPSTGGQVTFTISLNSYSFSPLTNLAVSDLLPSGLSAPNYVGGSTLITYPDLSQGTADPASSIDLATGRTRLTWTLSPSTMGVKQVLTVRFSVNIPAGAAQIFVNDAFGSGQYAGRTYSAVGGADVVRTSVSVTKLVTDDGSPEAGDVLTYSLIVTNSGVLAETGVRVTDPVPPGSTFIPGSIVSPAPFAGSFSTAQNAVVWTAANLAAGASATLSFQVRINSDAKIGRVLANSALYESTQTPTFYSNETLTTVVGPALTQAKTIVNGAPAVLHPGELVPFEVQVKNTGSGAATNLLLTDALAFSNATYVAGTLQYSLNGAAFVSLTDAADADPGTLSGTTVQLQLASLGANADVRFRFQARVNPGTAGLSLNNQATVSTTQVGTSDTNLVQVPIVGNATVTGRVFLDVNANGVLDVGEFGIPNVNVRVTDSTGITQIAVTDASGAYTVVVPAGATTLDVDETDPDMPPGAIPTTGNDPQNVTAVASATVASANVGYRLPNLTVTKASSAGGQVQPGQTVTYTVAVTNNTTTTQTGITVTDTVPTGTTYVAGSARVTYGTPALRVTEYFIPAGSFTGTSYTLTLAQNLAPDYFAIVQGSAGNGSNNGDRGPDGNYVSVVQDGYGTGDLNPSALNQIVLQRQMNDDSWVGVVTVVECLASCTTAGFRLLDVQRVTHLNAAIAGTDNSAVAWSDVSRVMLMGGFNGAGCDTADNDNLDHKTCHARFNPSGATQINWTRDAGGVSLEAATSTVMVVQWGSEWTVQRRAITGGNNGNTGVDATDEYNTVAINPVSRRRTWVWGTGHTNSAGTGAASEGVVLTLGDGVNQLATESLIAAGVNYPNLNLAFDVYALTHPGLVAGHVFQPSAGTTNLFTSTVTLPEAGVASRRMALGYNSLEANANNYPRPMFSARYTAATTVQLERRRAGVAYAAWVQGIDFSGVTSAQTVVCADTPATCNQPSTSANIVVPANGYTIPPRTTLTVTFQVVVNASPPLGLTEIVNTASVSTTQNPGPAAATARDTLVRPAVDVDPNNAGYANAGTTINFTHFVKNTGNQTDSYTLTVTGERGWRVDLIDPNTGVVLATDTNADGTWDVGSPPSTGSLAPGASKEYRLRVWVPGGTPAGIQDTVRLRATSTLSATRWDEAEDEITVLPSGSFGQVIVTPDNSGVVAAGSYTAYAHRVINNTGVSDTFDLQADSSQSWTSTIHWDTNGDGIYTPGTDLQITNTAQLPPGASQLVFVVVNAPGGTPSGTVDVTHLTATSRNNNTLFGAATDTSTVVTNAGHDLSGGGSRVVAPGDVSVHPGTLVNLASASDRFDIAVSMANLYGVDGLAHPTELWVDAVGNDGVPDTLVATDSDGDGTWDTITPGWDTNGNGLPDVLVAGAGNLAYELRRAVDPAQRIQRDHVTLTSTSIGSPTTDPDNVTATWVFAAVTRAGIRGVRVDPGGEVSFVTSTQAGTASFMVYETDDPTGFTRRVALHDEPVLSPVPDSLTPILYRVPTRPVRRPFVMIAETETDGDVVWKGPFAVGDTRLRKGFDTVESLMDRAGMTRERVQRMRGMRPLALAAAEATTGASERSRRTAGVRSAGTRSATAAPTRKRRAALGVKVVVHEPGVVELSRDDLAEAGLPRLRRSDGILVTNLGQDVPFEWFRDAAGAWALRFEAAGLSTDYSGSNVYVVTAQGRPPAPLVPLTRSSRPTVPGFTRVERNALYIPSLPEGPDPWQWDLLFSGWPWPDPDWDPAAGDFDIPNLAPGASGTVAVRLQLAGYTDHRHAVTASINGMPVGSVGFEGRTEANLEGSISAAMLHATGNKLSVTYVGDPLPNSPAGDAMIYLDFVDLAVPLDTAPRPAVFDLEPYASRIPSLRRVEYLVVTHPLFRPQADRLAALKAAEGLRALVVETDSVYDRASGGVVEPLAIQLLVREAWRRSGRLRYVVLVGDDTFDPRDYIGTGARAYVPTLFSRDATWGLVPSETPFADVDGDGRPDVAIGRLPVQTPAEAAAIVDKVASQVASLQPVRGAQLVVSDNATETDAPFREEATRALALLPPTPEVTWSDVSQGTAAARSALVGAWQSGVMVSHYFGHGGLTEWADEQVLTRDDVTALGSSWKPTVLFTWACLSQWNLGIEGPALNEALLLQPGGGTVASFGPAGITPPARQTLLIDALYRELGVEGVTLGEAIRRAKASVLEENPDAREVIDGFHLFGDPALRIPWAPPEPR